MELRKVRLCILLSALLACRGALLSQQATANAQSAQKLPVGVWQSEQPDGSVVGIDLLTVEAGIPNAVYPEGTPKPEGSRLQVGVFQRRHEKVACSEENFFVTGWTGPGSEDGFTVYANRKLEVHYHDRVSGSEIHLELALDPIKDAWTGHFHRDKYDGQVILHRASYESDPAQGGCFIEGAISPHELLKLK